MPEQLDDIDTVVAALRSDLLIAMRARDRHAVTALRTMIAAIANAEAPPDDGTVAPTHGRLVDHTPLVLSPTDVRAILLHQIDDRRDTLGRITSAGRPDAVDALEAEIAVIARYV